MLAQSLATPYLAIIFVATNVFLRPMAPRSSQPSASAHPRGRADVYVLGLQAEPLAARRRVAARSPASERTGRREARRIGEPLKYDVQPMPHSAVVALVGQAEPRELLDAILPEPARQIDGGHRRPLS